MYIYHLISDPIDKFQMGSSKIVFVVSRFWRANLSHRFRWGKVDRMTIIVKLGFVDFKLDYCMLNMFIFIVCSKLKSISVDSNIRITKKNYGHLFFIIFYINSFDFFKLKSDSSLTFAIYFKSVYLYNLYANIKSFNYLFHCIYKR